MPEQLGSQWGLGESLFVAVWRNAESPAELVTSGEYPNGGKNWPEAELAVSSRSAVELITQGSGHKPATAGRCYSVAGKDKLTGDTSTLVPNQSQANGQEVGR